MRSLLHRAILGAALVAGGPAGAFVITPDERQPGRYVVFIESTLGERIPLDLLPSPYGRLGSAAWVDAGLWFGWSYFRSPEKGRAEIVFGEGGRAALTFEFFSDELADGDTVGVAVALIDGKDEPLVTVYAAARVAGERFAGGDGLHRSAALLDAPPGGWGEVAGFIFLTPKYYAIRNLDDDGVAQAMRRAVARVTGGGGPEIWARSVAD